MKYIDVPNIAQAYKNFQDSMTNKSWGVLCIMKQLTSTIVPGHTYAINCSNLSTFIENLFCLSNDKKTYADNGKNWYVKFSSNWDSFFFKQKQKKPNIYDLMIWVNRNEALPDNVNDEYLIKKFSQELNISDDIINKVYDVHKYNIKYTYTKYKEMELLSAISKLVGRKLDKNITADCKSITASPGELSRGPFIQTLYAALDTTDYVLISQTDFDTLYPMGIDLSRKKTIIPIPSPLSTPFRPYITALRTKPFLLLAGISGTGKSRIVRELARACWKQDNPEHGAHKPRNFEMVQVKPNWHDSTELIGYVSRISGKAEFVAGDFLKFVAKAWKEPEIPYFLCLDEMNLAPVEQYFAEFLSVLESRKLNNDLKIVTDPILKKDSQDWYFDLTSQLADNDEIRHQFLNEGITLPQNLIIVGTVNMDETTFSFSRKVLDRAMTIEMNKVDLKAGLETHHEIIGEITKNQIIADSVEGVDIYNEHKEICDRVLELLQKVNDVLEGTPFKIAYRTRNEFLLYVVNNLPYDKDGDGNQLSESQILTRSLDEITCMKILPRIEGDAEKTSQVLKDLQKVLTNEFSEIFGDGFDEKKSVSLQKIDEMNKRLKFGFTSFWS